LHEGFLPTASIAFLDEIFKANSAILNTLLTILNEREFDNGSSSAKREVCPIRCVVGASNELPESEELDALYDRFLLRKEVLPVSDEGIMTILRMPTPGATSCDSADCELLFTDGLDQLVQSLAIAANYIEMGDDACALMRDLRTFMRSSLDTTVSDRRLIKAARLLKLSAASHGRTRVDPIDCLLLQHIAWRLPEQRSAVKEWLWDHLTPGGGGGGVDDMTLSDNGSPKSGLAGQSQLLLDNLCREVRMLVRKTGGDVSGAAGARENDVQMIRQLRNEIAQIAMLLQQRASLLARHVELLNRSTDHLWLHPDESQAIQQLLLPKAVRTLRNVQRVLAHAHALEMSLHDDDNSNDNSSSSPSKDVRLSVIEQLAEENDLNAITFTEDELSMDMRDAKQKYGVETFRAWKRARKKAQQT
jgi:MoxR-like ATPase